MPGGLSHVNGHCSVTISTILTKSRGTTPDVASDRGARYQACVARQCGQATVVETGARKTKPQWQA
jgi:hypothetical protein